MTVGALLSPLFQFAVSQGVCISLQCLAVNMNFSLTTFNEDGGNVFLWLADVWHTQQTHSSSSSSSYCGASVPNALNVLQPYWLILLPLDVPALTASLLLWGPSGQRWRCLWTVLFSEVPAFATSCLWEVLAAKGGTTWARNGRWILPENARLPRNIQGPLTCRKSMTRDIQLWSRLNLRTWYQRPARYL